eukprot:gene43-12856_t
MPPPPVPKKKKKKRYESSSEEEEEEEDTYVRTVQRKSGFNPANYCTAEQRSTWWCKYGFLIDDIVGTDPGTQETHCTPPNLIANTLSFLIIAISAALLGAWAAHGTSWVQLGLLAGLKAIWLLYVALVRPYSHTLTLAGELILSGAQAVLLALAIIKLAIDSMASISVVISLIAAFVVVGGVVVIELVRALFVLLSWFGPKEDDAQKPNLDGQQAYKQQLPPTGFS